MNYEKIGFILTIAIIIGLATFGIISSVGSKQLKSTIESSRADLDRIIELEQRISEYDKATLNLELREADVRIKYSGIELREKDLDIRKAEIELRVSKLTIREKDYLGRKSELESRVRFKLIELDNKIRESNEFIKYIKDKYAGDDNGNSIGDDSTDTDN